MIVCKEKDYKHAPALEKSNCLSVFLIALIAAGQAALGAVDTIWNPGTGNYLKLIDVGGNNSIYMNDIGHVENGIMYASTRKGKDTFHIRRFY